MAAKGGISFFASVVTLCKTIIGAGLLALPFAQAQTGLLLGVVLLVAMAIVTAFVLHLFAVCVVNARAPGRDPPSFFSLAIDAGLSPVLIESCVALATFGFATSYLVVMADLAPEIVSSLAGGHDQLPSYVGGAGAGADEARYFWISVLGGAVGLPLMMLRQLDMLKFSSVIGNIGIIYVVVVTTLIALGVLPDGGEDGGSGSGSLVLPQEGAAPAPAAAPAVAVCRSWSGCAKLGFAGNVPDALSVLSIYVFAFACTQSIPPIMAEMQGATLPRVNGVIAVSLFFCTSVFAICGIAGYYTYGSTVNADLLKCFPKNAVSTVARVGILLSVTGSYPIFMYIVRKSVCKMVYGLEPNALPFHKFLIVTLSIFGPSYTIAMVVKNLDTILGFVGSTVGMLVGFTIPGFIFTRLESKQRQLMSLQGSLQGSLLANSPGGRRSAAASAVGSTAGAPVLLPQPQWKVCVAMVVTWGSAVLIPVLVGVQVYSMVQSK